MHDVASSAQMRLLSSIQAPLGTHVGRPESSRIGGFRDPASDAVIRQFVVSTKQIGLHNNWPPPAKHSDKHVALSASPSQYSPPLTMPSPQEPVRGSLGSACPASNVGGISTGHVPGVAFVLALVFVAALPGLPLPAAMVRGRPPSQPCVVERVQPVSARA